MVQHFELNCLEVCWHIYLNSSIGFFFFIFKLYARVSGWILSLSCDNNSWTYTDEVCLRFYMLFEG